MVGLCIRYFHKNYGGLLQAYATVEYFKKKKVNIKLIRFYRDTTFIEKIKDVPRLINRVWLNDKLEATQRNLNLLFNRKYNKNNQIRMSYFDEFIKEKFEPLVDEYHGYKELCSNSKSYNAVITGSDQLWSPAGLPTNFYNLMFVPNNILKISLSSSFGVDHIFWYQKRRTRNFLNRIDYISMRENSGSKIVKELTGKTVPTILDPVFFLDEDEWLELIPNKREIIEPYIFVYFLGDNSLYRKSVESLARELKIKIVAIKHMDQFVKKDVVFGDYEPYEVGPIQFLNLLRNAEYICTDSFHGMAFSIINRKQFVVFNRYSDNSSFSKNSRIDTLCINFGLENRRYRNNMNLIDIISNDIDYSIVSNKLYDNKKITNEYLNGILQYLK